MTRVAGRVAACAGVAVALVAVTGASASAPQGHAASTTVEHLRAGDSFNVKGTRIHCVVIPDHPAPFVACQLFTSPGGPKIQYGDYGIDMVSSAAVVQRAEPNSAPVVKQVNEPRVSGASFPTPAAKSGTLTASAPAGILVGGTHIFCAVNNGGAAGVNVACGLTTVADGLRFPAGTYVVSLGDRYALLAKVISNTDYKTITLKSEP